MLNIFSLEPASEEGYGKDRECPRCFNDLIHSFLDNLALASTAFFIHDWDYIFWQLRTMAEC